VLVALEWLPMPEQAMVEQASFLALVAG